MTPTARKLLDLLASSGLTDDEYTAAADAVRGLAALAAGGQHLATAVLAAGGQCPDPVHTLAVHVVSARLDQLEAQPESTPA